MSDENFLYDYRKIAEPCVELEDGEILISVGVSTENDLDEDMIDAMSQWVNGGYYASIFFEFKIDALLDFLMDNYDTHGDGMVHSSAREEFDAMRAALVRQIERIDAVKYRPD